MTYYMPFIYSVNTDTRSLIEHALSYSDACKDGGVDCSSNGAYVVDQ